MHHRPGRLETESTSSPWDSAAAAPTTAEDAATCEVHNALSSLRRCTQEAEWRLKVGEKLLQDAINQFTRVAGILSSKYKTYVHLKPDTITTLITKSTSHSTPQLRLGT